MGSEQHGDRLVRRENQILHEHVPCRIHAADGGPQEVAQTFRLETRILAAKQVLSA